MLGVGEGGDFVPFFFVFLFCVLTEGNGTNAFKRPGLETVKKK